MGTQTGHILPFLGSVSLKKRKRKSISNNNKKKNNCLQHDMMVVVFKELNYIWSDGGLWGQGILSDWVYDCFQTGCSLLFNYVGRTRSYPS